MNQPELGKKIAEIRKAKGLTQEELVEKCNLNVRTLQRIESGVVMPRSYTVKLIFAALEYKDSMDKVPNKLNENEHLSTKRLEHLYRYVLDIFNLKTNKMKKLSILSASFIFTGISLIFIFTDIKAQKHTIVIDAGHGGKDVGAQAIENNITLSIVTLLQEKAKSNSDFKLVFTRDSDEYVGLNERAEKTKEVKADLFISIHINTNVNKDLSGIELYSATESEYKTKSESIGRLFVDEFKQLKGIKTHDSIKQANFMVLKRSNCPALLISIGYLSNPQDLSFVSNIHNQRMICDKIINAIERIDK